MVHPSAQGLFGSHFVDGELDFENEAVGTDDEDKVNDGKLAYLKIPN